MMFEFLTDSAHVQNLGWTLFHSIWQIVFVWIWLRLALKFAVKSSANFRYLIACAALGAAFALPCATFVWLENSNAANSNLASRTVAEQTNQLGEEILPTKNQAATNSNTQLTESQSNAGSLKSFENFTQDFSIYLNPILPLIAALWFGGASLFALRAIGGLRQLRRLRKDKTKPLDREQTANFKNLCERVGVWKTVEILESGLVSAPVVVGWLKPLILIPASALCGLTAQQLEAVLVHELMHVRRHDFLVNLMQTSVEIALFYHPCAWWISQEIRDLREFACDDATIKFYGEPLLYATALAQLETVRQTWRAQQSPQLVLAATGGKLMFRIKRILHKETEITRASSLWSAVVALGLISAFATALFSWSDSPTVNAESNLKSKKIAIGFVSIPPADRSDNPPQDSIATAQILIEKLKSHRVPAIGFLLGASVSDGEKLFPARAEIVRNWCDAGFEVGIGGYKHIWFYDTAFDDYVENAEKNERIAKQILAEKNLTLRYFSYPFLNTGKTVEDKTRFESWLKERGLQSIRYTFDNSEWMYSYAYDMARFDNDVELMRRIRREYTDYMAKMLVHYEAYSSEMFGRDIAQTMVLTPSRLVADTADEVFGMLEKNGYEFVSMTEAQSDAAYQTPETFANVKAGISWFERWTITQKKKLRDEPKVSELVEKTWAERKPGK